MKVFIKIGLSRTAFLLAFVAFWPQHLSAQVHYSDIIQDEKIQLYISPSEPQECSDEHFKLDVNLDGTVDFMFHAKCGYHNDQPDSAMISIESASSQDLFVAHEYVDTLNFNDTIASSLQWISGEAIICCSNSYWTLGGEHFVGLRVMTGSLGCFGWIRMKITILDDKLTAIVKDFAFQPAPEESILAGEGLETFALNIRAKDVGEQGNGADMKVYFDPAYKEEGIVEYRIMVVKSEQAATFSVDSANAVTAGQYISVPANGNSHSIQLNSTATSTDGQPIANKISYSVFILTSYDNPSENVLSYPVPIVLQTPTAAVTHITCTDIGDAGNGSDIRVTFNKVANENIISEYRIMVVPGDQMSTFDLETANLVGQESYTAVTPSDSNISIQLDETASDIDGDIIINEKEYCVFVLSVADGILTDRNALSMPSNLFILYSPNYIYAGQHDQPYIHYVDIEPDTAIISPADGGVYFDFDLNGDGTMDYQFLCYEYGGVGFGSAGSLLKGLNENNKVITSVEKPTWIKKLYYGDLITFMDEEIALEKCIYCSSHYSEWDEGWSGYWWGADPDNYTGLIMIQGADTIMGWVKMEAGVVDLVIKEYASMIYSKRVQARFDYTKTDYQVQFYNNSVSAASFEWDFGDGEHSSEREPLHTYSHEGYYDVCLTAVTGFGQDTICETINICEKPTAGFWHELSDWGEISLYNLSLKAERYHWDFGNGDTSEEESPHYTYQEHGTYNITLIAFRGSCSDTISAKATVCIHPRANFYYTLADNFVVFFNTSLKPDSIYWDFGDGSGSNISNPVHTFPSQSNYPVTLYVYNICGRDSITQIISLSLEDNPDLLGIDLYPVPARDRLMIKPSFPVRKIDAWLCDPSGRLIQAYPDRRVIYPILELDLSAVKEGLYILKLLLDDRLIIRKVIIMR